MPAHSAGIFYVTGFIVLMGGIERKKCVYSVIPNSLFGISQEACA